MKYKLKVKPSKELGHKFEPFEIEIEEIGWDQRVIINDYADTNPYPSCSSISIERNGSLKSFFKF